MTVRSTPRLGLITILLATFTIAAYAAGGPVQVDRGNEGGSYTKSIEKWQAARLEEINGEDGWTTLVGLFWLKQGQNRFGSDPSNDIVLPRSSAPRFAGSLHLVDASVMLDAKPDAGLMIEGKPVSNLVLQSDAEGGKPTVLKLGSLKLFVIKRGERLGLRVKDKEHPARIKFSGLSHFPIQTNLRINAKFLPYNPPKIIPIVNVLGMIDNMTSPGKLIFEFNGKSHSVDPVLEKGSQQLFVIFADKTNGKDTYGAGRYLYADPPGADGNVILDFNKAHNPSCAFTKFATCPLPPRQNRLAIRIEAGEKKYAGPGH